MNETKPRMKLFGNDYDRDTANWLVASLKWLFASAVLSAIIIVLVTYYDEAMMQNGAAVATQR